MIPKWFSAPNDVLTEQDIREQLEYERVQLAMREMDYAQSCMRVKNLEMSLGEHYA